MTEARAQPTLTDRHLVVEELSLLDEANALAQQCGDFVAKLRRQPDVLRGGRPASATEPGSLDQQWITMGATDLQIGFMKIIRGIAQPKTF